MAEAQGEFFTKEANVSEISAHHPLAARMRARSLEEVVGQDHLLGDDCLLPKLLRNNQFGSIIFFGPPGCGKTTLAEIIAHQTGSRFVRLNAVLSNVAEMRDALKLARYHMPERTILFIDEIHRFNKAQQDLLLPDVEAGTIRLIGATTHNPGFYINAPLLSRSHLFHLTPVSTDATMSVLKRALEDGNRGLAMHRCKTDDDVLRTIADLSDGDLRRALNALETLVLSLPIGGTLTLEHVRVFAEERQIRYDSSEDEHYDTISAFIKSVRGGDPDAALYWLAKMLEGGEDPRFIARRLVILASEDVGLADSRALPLATAAFQACEIIGMPECRINLFHATVFLATAPKSNTAYMAGELALETIKKERVQSVPVWLRDYHGAASKALGHGNGYLYSHNYTEAVSGQYFMEDQRTFYTPKDVGAEAAIGERIARWRKMREEKNKES